MNDIKTNTKSPFFPKDKKTNPSNSKNSIHSTIKSKDQKKKQTTTVNKGETDVKVDIPKKIKDFSMIKKAVDMSPDVDNSQKIALLKKQIASGEYKMNYDKIADKVLEEEMEIRSPS